MDDMELSEMEIASLSVVHEAGRDFAAALAETPQFKAFEQAYEALRQDAEAQKALAVFREKAESLEVMLQLNAVSEAAAGGVGTTPAKLYEPSQCSVLRCRSGRIAEPLPTGRCEDLLRHRLELRLHLWTFLLWVMP